MSQLQKEIDANHAAFFKDWTLQAAKNWKTLQKHPAYEASYRRLSAIQALKAYLVVPTYSKPSAAFFFEAHNDTLVSHVNASVGAWRASLQSLRSCIENALCAAYYNEHPVELELWGEGKFIIGLTELLRYFEKHPRLSKLAENVSGLGYLRAEYATLSKAVHASAANFRMTDPVSDVLLWDPDPVKAAMWSAREKRTIEGVCLLLTCLHSERLQGTQLTPLRDALSFSLSASSRTLLKQAVSVIIQSP
ncbi:hypothetical protein [Bradyrhizobium sp. Bra78]|uniref:hypothetical protein n=1 Tax=Bradyrhizobium sp. Bra78 TaxID=2926010 RepID=UPI0021C6C5B2|nr:hypothetical protein [Bradyrhizobium sp. Bra78]